MLKRKFEKTRGNCRRVQQICSTCRNIRDIDSFLPKEVRNVQRTEEFVRAIEKFEKLSIPVYENQLQIPERKTRNKATGVMLSSHFREMLIVIVRTIQCIKEKKIINCLLVNEIVEVISLADSILKLNTEINIFIKQPENENPLHFAIDTPVQSCPEKGNQMQDFCSWCLMEIFPELFTILSTPGNVSLKK